jgi:hypothetical protein
LTKVTKFIDSRSLSSLPFAHSSAFLFFFVFCPNLTFSTLALLAPATLIGIWDFVGDVDRGGEEEGGSEKVIVLVLRREVEVEGKEMEGGKESFVVFREKRNLLRGI